MSEFWKKLTGKLTARSRRPLQWMLFGGFVLGLLLLSMLSVEMSEKSGGLAPVEDPYAIPEMEPADVAAPGGALSGEDVWITRSESQLRSLQGEVRELRRELEEMRREREARAHEGQDGGASDSGGLPALPAQPVNAPAEIPRIGPAPQPASGGLEIRPAPMQLGSPSGAVPAPGGGAQPPQPEAGIVVVRMEAPRKEERKDEGGVYLTVSFTRARFLNGLDAPTGGQAQRNPVPVLMEVTDPTQLPNRFREDFRECFILAGGYGDISSERAYLRLDKLACVDDDGRAIEEPIEGYVTGPDGKVGVRGRLVSKQGQVLAKALLAGIASGIGNSFTQAAMTQTVSPLGVTQALNPKKALQAGVFNGVGQALNKLADFYIKQAEKMYPVIEVASGTEVDVILKTGVRIPHWHEGER